MSGNSKAPWMKFYVRDFLSDESVSMMRYDELGMYITLICHDWNDDGIPADECSISRLLKLDSNTFDRIWEVVGRCFLPYPKRLNRLTNPRVHQERLIKNRLMHLAKASADHRWKPLKNKDSLCGRIKTASKPQCEADANQIQIQIISPIVPLKGDSQNGDGFAEFWNSYPRKIAKIAAMKAWKKIKPSHDLKIKMISAIGQQVKSGRWSDTNFIPYPATWLNGQRWEDQIDVPIEKNQPKQIELIHMKIEDRPDPRKWKSEESEDEPPI